MDSMFDAHIHIARENGKQISEPHAGSIFQILHHYASLGITALRDGGDELSLGLVARELATDLGIRYLTPIRALAKRGGYGGFIGAEVSGIREIRSELLKLKAQKADFIKIIQSGIVSFDRFGEISGGGFSPEELDYIINFARDAFLKVMVHANGEKTVALVLEKGANSIEHGYFISSENILAMAELGTVWTPTFAPLSNFLRYANPQEGQRHVVEQTLAAHRSNLLHAIESGVIVAVGSDAGAFAVPHGQGLFDEIDCFIDAGMFGDEVKGLMRKNRELVIG
jgi:hypothetical protein